MYNMEKNELLKNINILYKDRGAQSMILSRELAIKLVEELKAQGKKVVFTNGCFDILHVGHLRYMNEAKRQGDVLIVGVNSDASVKRLKGESRPINNENDRAEMLSGLEAVDFTIIFSEDTPISLIEAIKPSVHVKGGDYKKDDLPETEVVETTNIVNKINCN